MKILYAYGNCSEKKYKELLGGSPFMIMQQSQKYHSLLIKGLTASCDGISVVSGLPINRKVVKKVFLKGETEKENDVSYHYYRQINLPVLRQISIFLGGFFAGARARKNSQDFLLCDVLNISNAYGIVLGAKLSGVKKIGIVTDVPSCRAVSPASLRGFKGFVRKIVAKINQRIIYGFDGYVLLTEQMNKLVNPNGKPNIVLEGHSDKDMLIKENRLSDKYEKRIILYAGSLKKIYGIKMFTEAFELANLPNCEFHIYGDGDFKEELLEICKNNKKIKYMGVKPNSYIVEEELKSTLLVNPRPTGGEYTKYSFPSKNMEYMASGTPLMTTKLPGMPEEYYPFVYLIEDESADGIARKLREILSNSRADLHEFGGRAKQFVLAEKNNEKQAAKIVDFLKNF